MAIRQLSYNYIISLNKRFESHLYVVWQIMYFLFYSCDWLLMALCVYEYVCVVHE